MRVSTQVMDCSFAAPAADVDVRLRRQAPAGAWSEEGRGQTNPDGWLSIWLGSELRAGVYRLEYDLDEYYSALGCTALNPRAIVEFRVTDPQDDMHLQLLVTPSSVHSYRGHFPTRGYDS